MPIFHGILIPVNWDKKGNVIAVAISTMDEEEYIVDDDVKGREMLKFVQKEVEVSGEVRGEEGGKKIVVVRTYRIIPPSGSAPPD